MELELRATFPEVRAHFPNGTAVPGRLVSAEQGSARTTLRLLLNPAASERADGDFPGVQVEGTIPRALAGPILAASDAAAWPSTPTRLRLLSVTLDVEGLVRTLHSGASSARDGVTAAVDQLAKALWGVVAPRSSR